tara:strand:+ start:881 stop:1132 length:252 start_codon:yes stop_codon:yes gene_type:complete
MKPSKTKHIIILLLSVLILFSCRSKKKIFNGTTSLDCPEYDVPLEEKEVAKKKSKWRLVLYKDGSKVGAKSKKGKSRLFKKKN